MQVTEGNVWSSLNLNYFRLSEFFFLVMYWWVINRQGCRWIAIQLGSSSLATKKLYLSMYKMRVRLESALGEQLA